MTLKDIRKTFFVLYPLMSFVLHHLAENHVYVYLPYFKINLLTQHADCFSLNKMHKLDYRHRCKFISHM